MTRDDSKFQQQWADYVNVPIATLGHSQEGPVIVAIGEGHITRLIATEDHSSNYRKTSSAHCYFEYEAFTSLRILVIEPSRVFFLKKLKRPA
jgi:hypothetical protein